MTYSPEEVFVLVLFYDALAAELDQAEIEFTVDEAFPVADLLMKEYFAYEGKTDLENAYALEWYEEHCIDFPIYRELTRA